MTQSTRLPSTHEIYRNEAGHRYKVLHFANKKDKTADGIRRPVTVVYQNVENDRIFTSTVDEWWKSFELDDPVKQLIDDVYRTLCIYGAPEARAHRHRLRATIGILERLPDPAVPPNGHDDVLDKAEAKGWNQCLAFIRSRRNARQELG